MFFLRNIFISSLLLFAASVASGEIGNNASYVDINIADSLLDYCLDLSKYFSTSQLDSFRTSRDPFCSDLCSTLQSIFLDQVFLPGKGKYTQWRSSAFWSSQQAEVQPACIFQPERPRQAAVGLLLTRLAHCAFAVKSGGHSAFAGGSSIKGGLTIDLVRLNSTVLSTHRKTARVGAGLKWGKVYKALEPEGLAVIGGRDCDIGVGGLTLGGGVSYFSGKYGWVCDNVVNYELVTANGRILNANVTSNADLYWALRGGGNNFGIVTGFDLSTIPQGLMWGGSRIYNITHKQALIESYMDLHSPPPDSSLTEPDHDAHLMLSFSYISRIRTLANTSLDFNMGSPSGFRQSMWTATFKPDKSLLSDMVDIYVDEVTPLIARQNTSYQINGFRPTFTFQPVTQQTIFHMSLNGGNPLGLFPRDEFNKKEAEIQFLTILGMTFTWSDARDDEVVLKAAGNIIDRCKRLGQKRGLYHPYLYMNYASQFQDVLGSYGKMNVNALRNVRKVYDEQNVFGELQPGHFKI